MPAPYDTVTTVLNAARTRLNDRVEALAAISGKLLDNTQAFTQTVVNDAWRKLQAQLADLGYQGLQQELTFTNVGASLSVDPAVEVNISYDGYFNGSATVGAPILPQTFIRPYRLWERANGSAALMTEMDEIPNGLPAVAKANWNRQWQWRNDALYMPGALLATDIRISYAQLLADFVDVGSTPWYAASVPIMRCTDSFADYICREISIAREDMEGAAMFQASAEANAQQILNRDSAEPKRIRKVSEYQKMADRYTPAVGPNTQPIKR